MGLVVAWSNDSSLSLPVKEMQILRFGEQKNDERKQEDEGLSSMKHVPVSASHRWELLP